MVIQIIFIILGFILLVKGADILVEGSSAVAKKVNIPEIIIGLTIVSIGTSMPEIFVSITSILRGYEDMSIGNIIGSNICNLLLILGISALIRPMKFQKQTKWFENILSVVLTIIFLIMCNTNNEIQRIEGIILIVLFFLFMIYTIKMSIKNRKAETMMEIKNAKKINILKNSFLIILGIILLKIGGGMVVNNAEIIARMLNVSEKVISLTIVAIGTSLPELVTSVVAAIRGDSDIAIGNIVGSNIFNMLLIIGVTSVISPIEYNTTYNVQMITLLIGTVMIAIIPFIEPKDKMSRGNGMLFITLYVIYLIELLINSN